MSFDLVRGDLNPSMPLDIVVAGTAWDLSGADTVEMHWTDPNGVEYTRALTVVNALLGQFQLDWIAGDTDVVGPYQGQVVATTSGAPKTFPSDGSKVIWFVNPQVGDC